MDVHAAHLLDQFDALNEAILAIASELDLDAVLQRVADLARTLVGAKYCALGIVGPDSNLTDFITSGISAAERAAMGDLPHGHGILGVLIREQRSLRLPDIAADPHAHGFPPHHPPMTTFLGVPIRVGAEAGVNLYLTEKIAPGGFTADDQRLVERLARHAAIAVVNARRFAAAETQRRLFETICEHIPEGVTIREAPGGRLLATNSAARDLLGLATLPPEGLGRARPPASVPPDRTGGRTRFGRRPLPAPCSRGIRASTSRSCCTKRTGARCISRRVPSPCMALQDASPPWSVFFGT